MESEFNFFQQWYPLLPVEDIDPKQPRAITILGIQLVIWKSKSSDFRVFLDRCPHRLAPLSEGRIDEQTGNLMCSYHGWQFDERGICTHIPQAENLEIASKQSQNLCAVVLPVRQQQDLLWVWLDASSSREQADSTPLPLSPQIDASKGFVWSSFVRDLEYDWQTLVENVADPSHVPFAHHGVQGDRNKATPMPIEIMRSLPNLIDANVPGRLSGTITFEPPCRLEYALKFSDGSKQVGLVTYCVPVSPGKSRIVAQFPRNFAKTLHHLTPRWWEHINVRNQVLDGDMILLQQQEHFLQQRQLTESWKTAYQLPTSADRFVIEFRKWFDKYCHEQLPWSEVGINVQQTGNINNNRAQILDRYHQHTRHCSSCSRALLVVQRLQAILLIYFAITASAVALFPDAWRVKLGLPLIVTALIGLAAYAWLKYRLSPKFYFVDYIHAQK